MSETLTQSASISPFNFPRPLERREADDDSKKYADDPNEVVKQINTEALVKLRKIAAEMKNKLN